MLECVPFGTQCGKAMPGRHKLSRECLLPVQEFRPLTVEELEGKRRKDIENQLIKRDVKRQKLNEAHDAPGQLAKQARGGRGGASIRSRARRLIALVPETATCLRPILSGC